MIVALYAIKILLFQPNSRVCNVCLFTGCCNRRIGYKLEFVMCASLPVVVTEG